MRKAARLLSVLSLLLLAACFKNEDEQALDLVKTAYLDQDKSAPVGKILEGYAYFTAKSWHTFKTDQGKRIVEFTGQVDLAANTPERIATFSKEAGKQGGGDIVNALQAIGIVKQISEPGFPVFAQALGLKTEFLAQFVVLPKDRFEVAYVGERLIVDLNSWPIATGQAGGPPAQAAKIIEASDKGNSDLLDRIYSNRMLPLSVESVRLYVEYKKARGESQ